MDALHMDGWPRSPVLVPAPEYQVCMSQEAAHIRDRACRWRHCPDVWLRQLCSRTFEQEKRQPGANESNPSDAIWLLTFRRARRLCVVVRRRAQRRRTPWTHAHRFHRQRLLSLLRVGAPKQWCATAGGPAALLRTQRCTVRRERKALVAHRARPQQSSAQRRFSGDRSEFLDVGWERPDCADR